MLTDKDIQEAVENCEWRKDIHGTWVCGGNIVPCLKHIDDGRCDTLIKLFAKERASDESKNRRCGNRQNIS